MFTKKMMYLTILATLSVNFAYESRTESGMAEKPYTLEKLKAAIADGTVATEENCALFTKEAYGGDLFDQLSQEEQKTALNRGCGIWFVLQSNPTQYAHMIEKWKALEPEVVNAIMEAMKSSEPAGNAFAAGLSGAGMIAGTISSEKAGMKYGPISEEECKKNCFVAAWSQSGYSLSLGGFGVVLLMEVSKCFDQCHANPLGWHF